MYFILTNFYYQLEGPIDFNKNLEFLIDNPNNEESILIKKKLEHCLVSYVPRYMLNYPLSSKNKDEKSIQSILKEMISSNYLKTTIDQSLLDTDPLLFLAKISIIIRYDNMEIQKELEKRGNEPKILNDNNIDIKREKILKSIISFVSLILHNETHQTDNYDGETFIINTSSGLDSFLFDNNIFNSTQRFFTEYLYPDNTHREHQRSISGEKLIECCRNIERNHDNIETIIYVGEILDSINNTIDPKISIILMCSIFECLLTYKPKNGDQYSINKQFQDKLSEVIIYTKKYKNINQEDLIRFAKDFYNVRSCINHGNFKELNKILRKRKLKMEEELYKGYDLDYESVLSRYYIGRGYRFLNDILKLYLSDYNYINNIKNKILETEK